MFVCVRVIFFCVCVCSHRDGHTHIHKCIHKCTYMCSLFPLSESPAILNRNPKLNPNLCGTGAAVSELRAGFDMLYLEACFENCPNVRFAPQFKHIGET